MFKILLGLCPNWILITDGWEKNWIEIILAWVCKLTCRKKKSWGVRTLCESTALWCCVSDTYPAHPLSDVRLLPATGFHFTLFQPFSTWVPCIHLSGESLTPDANVNGAGINTHVGKETMIITAHTLSLTHTRTSNYWFQYFRKNWRMKAFIKNEKRMNKKNSSSFSQLISTLFLSLLLTLHLLLLLPRFHCLGENWYIMAVVGLWSQSLQITTRILPGLPWWRTREPTRCDGDAVIVRV